MKTTPEEKKAIVKEIRAFMLEWQRTCYPDLRLSQACFYWSVIAHSKLKEKGFSANITGGTMSWPRIDLAKDDGVVSTHFSYKWEPESEATLRMIAARKMPEMHVWVQLPMEQEIVDVTTRYIKQQCSRAGKMKWLAKDPPDFVWCRYDELPEGVHYDPDPLAVEQIKQMIFRTWPQAMQDISKP